MATFEQAQFDAHEVRDDRVTQWSSTTEDAT
jgi:hypothetical protein